MHGSDITNRVNIVESKTDSAVEAVVSFTHTAECNIITAYNICVPFPKMTTNMRYGAMRWRSLRLETELVLEVSAKMKREEMMMKGSRTMFDGGCLVMTLMEGNARGFNDRLRVSSELRLTAP